MKISRQEQAQQHSSSTAQQLVVGHGLPARLLHNTRLFDAFESGHSPHSRQIEHVPGVQRHAKRPRQSRHGRGIPLRLIRVPRSQRHQRRVPVDREREALALSDVRRRQDKVLVDARVEQRREQDEVLPADDLHKDVFKVVLVQGRRGPRVSDPEVDGVGLLAQGYPRERNVPLGVWIQRQVLISEVVVFFRADFLYVS